ncbi:MAG TPA: ATP-dependent Clp protease ATP-binding subunit [Blastocatellia bacterium]|nr:ATP-dependent Clp protease ATP-binding subunit [Blastocatellia bacterium]
MQREELLNLLAPAALKAFEGAKRLAWTNGGVVSPLHLTIGALDVLSSTIERPGDRQKLAPAGKNRLLSALHGLLLSRFPNQADRITVSKESQAAISDAASLASSDGIALVTPAHLLKAALKTSTMQEALSGMGQLEQELVEVTEGVDATPSNAPERAPATAAPPAVERKPLTGPLADFCADLAEQARTNSSHPFIGREREVTAVLETLCRKLKNNPLLIGKPGVGKTALVTAVASRLAAGNVPPRLRGKRILEVSRLRLLADAKYAGETEERLRQLLEEVNNAGDVILFFDEIHTLLSAGGAPGTGDVANLLKSALSKGEVSCVGATTLAEYYKYIARDEALARRFSTITIEEPSLEETQRILKDARGAFEAYHGVSIDDDAISVIVDMADRYLHARSFPDKGFDLLDKAAAKATIAGCDRLAREQIAETLSELTGLPLDLMDKDTADRLGRLEEFLNSAVPGQQRAARDVARLVRIAKLRLEVRPERPDGIFMFLGPEGVGKRELAGALARFLFGSAQKMIEFDMSQFTEQWSIARLIGAEPGYVGYGDRSGLLSKSAEDNPHSVLYFRNVDLAHNVVQQFLAEALDLGRFTDASGATITLSTSTVVMSLSQMAETNKPAQVGFFTRGEDTDSKRDGCWWGGTGLIEPLAAAVDEVIEFRVLDQEATERIIAERLEAVRARLEAAQPATVKMDPGLVRYFANRLAAERKAVLALDRMMQETIIVPFSQLSFDLQAARQGSAMAEAANVEPSTHSTSAGSRVQIHVSVEEGAVKVGRES